MSPAEALSHMNKGDPDGIVPEIYYKLLPELLRELVETIGSAPATAPVSTAPADPPSVQALLQRAIARPERLRTPARRRVALLQHYAACRTLIEASARAGIDRRTVNRWRAASAVFDQRLKDVAGGRREDAFEQAMVVASQRHVRPIFYKGEKVGEYEIPNAALTLYLLKQSDVEAGRVVGRPSMKAASERKSRPPAPADRLPTGETVAEAMQRAERMRRELKERSEVESHAREGQDSEDSVDEKQDAEPRPEKMSHSPGHREKSRSSGREKMSHSPGHRQTASPAKPPMMPPAIGYAGPRRHPAAGVIRWVPLEEQERERASYYSSAWTEEEEDDE